MHVKLTDSIKKFNLLDDGKKRFKKLRTLNALICEKNYDNFVAIYYFTSRHVCQTLSKLFFITFQLNEKQPCLHF